MDNEIVLDLKRLAREMNDLFALAAKRGCPVMAQLIAVEVDGRPQQLLLLEDARAALRGSDG